MKKLLVSVFYLIALSIISSCNEQNEIAIQERTIEYPENVMVFKTTADFENAFAQAKLFHREEILTYSNSLQIKNQHSYLNEVLEKEESILNRLDVDKLKNSLENEITPALETEIRSIQKDLIQLSDQFNDIIEFENNRAIGLKYKDEIMANFLNRDGLIIIGDLLFKYNNKEIKCTRYTGKSSLDEINDETSDKVDVFYTAQKSTNAREDNFSGSCDNAYSFGNPYAYYKGTLSVTNTWTPVYRLENVWIPEECIEKPNGGMQCFPGYWESVNVIDHYNLTNTRVYTETKSRRETCILFCFDIGGNSVPHSITLSGSYANYVSETSAKTTRSYDLSSPLAHGNIQAVFSYPNAVDGFRFCQVNVNW